MNAAMTVAIKADAAAPKALFYESKKKKIEKEYKWNVG